MTGYPPPAYALTVWYNGESYVVSTPPVPGVDRGEKIVCKNLAEVGDLARAAHGQHTKTARLVGTVESPNERVQFGAGDDIIQRIEREAARHEYRPTGTSLDPWGDRQREARKLETRKTQDQRRREKAKAKAKEPVFGVTLADLGL